MLLDVRRRPGLLAAILLLSGCNTPTTDRYVPKQAAARHALEATLDAWKAGKPHERIAGHSPPIDILVSRWRSGAKLTAYTITGEDRTEEGHNRFTVKLTLASPEATQEARFIVLGQDPLWVYGEEDYKKVSGM
jgi:hypothetical protein